MRERPTIRERRLFWSAMLVGLLLCSGLCSARARAADRVYWANSGATDAISWANLDGSAGGNLDTSGAELSNPEGVALDPATGRIFWANTGGAGSISWAYLDGSGGGKLDTSPVSVDEPLGVAIDASTRRIYWGNGDGSIRSASLEGGEGRILSTSGASTGPAAGLAVDPVFGVVYWAREASGSAAVGLSAARLDGTGGFDLNTSPEPVGEPIGVAVDHAGSALYWADASVSGKIGVELGLPGGATADNLGEPAHETRGVAVDPLAERVYWINAGFNQISYAGTFGSTPVSGSITAPGATFSTPNFPALLEAPVAVEPPRASGAAVTGSAISCSQGSWAPDLAESFLFRAPTSFAYQWSRDGADLTGATATTIVPAAPGAYRCRVTAANVAGQASQTSDPLRVDQAPSTATPSGGSTAPAPPSNRFQLGKVKLNRKKGTAVLPATVPGSGRLALAGNGVVGSSAAAHTAGTVDLLVKAKGKTRHKLLSTGKARVKVSVTFTPTGGNPNSVSAKLRLVDAR